MKFCILLLAMISTALTHSLKRKARNYSAYPYPWPAMDDDSDSGSKSEGIMRKERFAVKPQLYAGQGIRALDSTDTDTDKDTDSSGEEPEPGTCCDPRKCESEPDHIGITGRCLRVSTGIHMEINVLAENDCQLECMKCVTDALGLETKVDSVIKTCIQPEKVREMGQCVLDDECYADGVDPVCYKDAPTMTYQALKFYTVPNACVGKCIEKVTEDKFEYVKDGDCDEP